MTETGPQHNTHTHIILIKQSFLKVTDQFLTWQLGEGLLVYTCLHVYIYAPEMDIIC